MTSMYKGSPTAPGSYSVENGNFLDRLRKRGDEFIGDEGAIQANLHQTDLFAVSVQIIDDLFRNVAERPMTTMTRSASSAP